MRYVLFELTLNADKMTASQFKYSLPYLPSLELFFGSEP